MWNPSVLNSFATLRVTPLPLGRAIGKVMAGRAKYPSLMNQRTSKFAPVSQRQYLSIRGQRLNTDMIRTRSLMGLHPALDSLHVAPGNNGIDQMVTPAVLDIFFCKTKPEEIVGVIRQAKINIKKSTGNLACFVCIGFQHHRLLNAQQWAYAHRLSSLRSVFRRDVIRMRSIATFC